MRIASIALIVSLSACHLPAPARTSADSTSISSKSWAQFRTSLQANDLEQSLQSFAPHVRDQYRTLLSQKNLTELSRQLPELSEPAVARMNFYQYELMINGQEYPLVLTCYGTKCYITQL